MVGVGSFVVRFLVSLLVELLVAVPRLVIHYFGANSYIKHVVFRVYFCRVYLLVVEDGWGEVSGTLSRPNSRIH